MTPDQERQINRNLKIAKVNLCITAVLLVVLFALKIWRAMA